MDNNNFIPNTMVSSDSHSENASFVAMKTVNQMMPPVALYSSEIPFSAEAAMMNNGGYQHMDYSHSSNNNMMINNNSNHFMNYNQPHITTTPVVKSHHNTTTYSSPPTQNGYLQQQQQQIHQTGYLPMDSTTHTMMNNLNSMDIDDYFTPTNMDSMFAANNIYSPSTNSVTTNSSVIMMDTMSPSSPTHMLSPNNTTNNLNHHLMSPTQSMDTTFVSPVGTPYHHLLITDNLQQHDSNAMYPEAPIVPTNIGMSHHHYNQPNTMMYNNNGNDDMMLLHHHTTIQQQQPYFDRKGRRPLPRRHTVSTPYATTNMMITNNSNTNNKGKESEQQLQQQQPQQPVTKSRKSSLKAKRHRSLGKLDIFATSTSSPPPIPDLSTSTAFEPLSAKLELWTHEQLLERVMELEKEKETVVQTTNTNKLNEVTQDEGGESKASKVAANKTRSASQTDTELEEEEEEEDEEGSHICKWDNCSIEFKSLDDLINHVKVDHIGSGKANYYCCWKNCARQQKPFTKRHKMHNHLRTHTGERPFVCLEPDCGKKFSRPDSLTTHAKIHSNIRPYLCNNIDCGKAYYHLRSLRKHERTHLQKDITATTPPPPLPVVVMSNVTQQHTTTIHPDDHHDIVVQQQGEEVYSDWGLSAQAAVFNIMDRENSSFM